MRKTKKLTRKEIGREIEEGMDKCDPSKNKSAASYEFPLSFFNNFFFRLPGGGYRIMRELSNINYNGYNEKGTNEIRANLSRNP